ncbi:DNA topoisomerase 2-alpha [Dermatophagoides farinae]|uniref:DNA topoisomerase 2-alpha n=1 Tax=Dermatophagoides farinae TaxID=6954 RepID=A0A922I551_DERFA|nr:DNA topoisomerase 2-alpha [Dermatophagoides farinae]
MLISEPPIKKCLPNLPSPLTSIHQQRNNNMAVDYEKNVLGPMLDGTKESPPLIDAYESYCTDTTVRFVVKMCCNKSNTLIPRLTLPRLALIRYNAIAPLSAVSLNAQNFWNPGTGALRLPRLALWGLLLDGQYNWISAGGAGCAMNDDADATNKVIPGQHGIKIKDTAKMRDGRFLVNFKSPESKRKFENIIA